MYNLDFDTMRQVMQAHRQTGHLSADVSSGIARMSGPCHIEIAMKDGAIIDCVIANTIGDRLTGKDAIYNLSRLGRLRWSLTSDVPDLRVTEQPVVESAVVPRRAALVEPLQMRSWPRLHKRVFALVDGVTSTVKIAEKLVTSLALVDQALHDLQKLGVITTKQPGIDKPPIT